MEVAILATKILNERFGFKTFRPGQKEVVDALTNSGRALAVFPTGGGKSLCYELPALMWDGVTLVVSPLIALMKNQIDFLLSRGIAAARLDSSLTDDEARTANEQLRSGKLKLLYVAPERFNNERFLEAIRRHKIALFAIDEAHCISEWGHNFRPDYLKLAEIAKELNVERVLALTATATPAVVENVCARFGIPKQCAVVTGFYRPNLEIWTTPVPADDRKRLLLDRLADRTPGATIIYVTLQKTSEQVASMLERSGYPARPYHAGMDTDERASVQEWWMNSDKNIVVATIAFGMGIDKADVRYVYHYNLPKSLESYSQEIGRAGRDDASSIVELFACADDVPTLENFAYGDTPTPRALSTLIEYVFARPEQFDVSLYELSVRCDIRQLVLRTALTYIELLGFLKQGTPFYGSYKIKPLVALHAIVARFDGERGQFIKNMFARAKEGRTWFTLDLETVAHDMHQERSRFVRALEYLEQQGLAELQAADVRQQYSIIKRPQDIAELVSALLKRFQRREQQEVGRVTQVVDLVRHDGCQTNALAGYFGEARNAPCGHCTWCRTGKPQTLPTPEPLPQFPAGLNVSVFSSMRRSYPDALADPRQAARFLCGLTSPALVKHKLTRHSAFGTFEERRFADVLAWCELQFGAE
jgi:ATP-dependent DNA helicase RecQ